MFGFLLVSAAQDRGDALAVPIAIAVPPEELLTNNSATIGCKPRLESGVSAILKVFRYGTPK
jgi:hypothetical protein